MSGPSAAATAPSPLLPVLAATSLVLVTVSASLRPALTGSSGPPAWYRSDSEAERAGRPAPRIDLSAIPDPVVWAAQALTAVALLVAIVVLARRLLRAWHERSARARADAARLGRPSLPGHRLSAVDAAVADAAAAAAADLDGGVVGDPSDAVIRAWVRVEEAAAGSGVPRAASQTATEFTADLLRRGMADPTPVTTLLTSYGQARFGAEPLTATQVGHARDAFDAVHRRLATGRVA